MKSAEDTTAPTAAKIIEPEVKPVVKSCFAEIQANGKDTWPVGWEQTKSCRLIECLLESESFLETLKAHTTRDKPTLLKLLRDAKQASTVNAWSNSRRLKQAALPYSLMAYDFRTELNAGFRYDSEDLNFMIVTGFPQRNTLSTTLGHALRKVMLEEPEIFNPIASEPLTPVQMVRDIADWIIYSSYVFGVERQPPVYFGRKGATHVTFPIELNHLEGWNLAGIFWKDKEEGTTPMPDFKAMALTPQSFRFVRGAEPKTAEQKEAELIAAKEKLLAEEAAAEAKKQAELKDGLEKKHAKKVAVKKKAEEPVNEAPGIINTAYQTIDPGPETRPVWVEAENDAFRRAALRAAFNDLAPTPPQEPAPVAQFNAEADPLAEENDETF